MILKDILKNLNYKVYAGYMDENINIENLVYDSRKATANSLFVAIKGETSDGHKFIGSAYDLGCRVFVVNQKVKLPEDTLVLHVDNSRLALSLLSANFFDHPSKDMTVIGITGTKGKTSIAGYIKYVLDRADIPAATIGTNGIIYKDICMPSANTTPESYEVHKILSEMKKEGIRCVTMECSSGGLKMDRVSHVHFDIGIFTNLTADHIGPTEHPDFDDYKISKSKLFTLCKTAIINSDDKYASYMADIARAHGCTVHSFGIYGDSEYKGININKYDDEFIGMRFICREKICKKAGNGEDGGTTDSLKPENGKTESVDTRYLIPSPGIFSVYNALTVIAVCRQLNVSHRIIQDTLKDAIVTGRFEPLGILPYAKVISDYAHNRVSMENLCLALREYNPKRLICLFGSVGERTQIRRKDLGEIVSKYCDIAIITSEDPGYEDPESIMDEIERAWIGNTCKIIREADREKAVKLAIDMVQAGDFLVLAGKAGDSYQRIKGKKLPFDEKAIAIKYMKERLANECLSNK